MTAESTDLIGAYRRGLPAYLQGTGGEEALLRALDLGRLALARALSVMDIAEIHHAAMLASLRDATAAAQTEQLLTRGAEFLAHTLVPYEMTHRGFADANARLRELNEQLEQRVAERTEALRRSEERFRRLAENAPDAIYRYQVRPTRAFTYMSPAVTAILGYPPQAFYDDPDLLLARAHPDDRDAVVTILRGSGSRVGAPEAVRLQHADGRFVWVEMRHVPVGDETGVTVAFEGIARDITERKRAEEQHAQLIELEQTARAEAEAVRLREAFLAVAAHELKTPVTSLRAFTQLLMRQLDGAGALDPPVVRRTLQTFDRQSEKLSRLTEQLLDVSRIESGRLLLERSTVDLVSLIMGVVSAVRVTSPRHRVRLRAPRTLPGHVDPLRVEEVITNLLDNAVKYSPGGGPIMLSLRHSPTGEVQLAVRDHGIGIPPERRPWIFDRFYQAHAGQHRSGMGLGLYISRQIVDLHGGRIWVEHPAGGGTRMVVTLPAHIDPMDSVERA